MATSASTSISNSPYPLESQFYGFCPASFIGNFLDTIDSDADILVEQFIKQINQALSSSSQPAEVKDQVNISSIREASKKALHLNFDKFELYCLKNLFLLPEDVDLTPDLTAEDTHKAASQASVDKKLNALIQKIVKQRNKKRALLARKAALKEVIPALQRVTDHLEKAVSDLMPEGGASILKEAMALSSEAQSYTSKLTEVQGKLESATVKLLGDASSDSGMNPALLNEAYSKTRTATDRLRGQTKL